MRNAMKAVGCTMLCIAILSWGEAAAQLDQAIAEKDLVEPWSRARAVVLSLADLIDASVEPDKRTQLDRDLSRLDDELAKLQSQQENVAIRIVSNPAFVYDASVTSLEMSAQVSEIEASLDALLGDLMVRQRPDVVATQESLASLRRTLGDQNRLERDVVGALGSGGKNEIQALASRWWTGAESVEGVRKAVADVRRRLAALPSNDRRNRSAVVT
jgi:hypothetical protein